MYTKDPVYNKYGILYICVFIIYIYIYFTIYHIFELSRGLPVTVQAFPGGLVLVFLVGSQPPPLPWIIMECGINLLDLTRIHWNSELTGTHWKSKGSHKNSQELVVSQQISQELSLEL